MLDELQKAIKYLNDGRITHPAAFVEGWLESAGFKTSYREVEAMLASANGNGLNDPNDIPLDDLADWSAGCRSGIPMFIF